MKNVLKIVFGLLLFASFFACRGNEDSLPPGNKIQGEWILQNTVAGRTVTYNFRANDVVITESGTVTSSNTYSYSVFYENYKDPKNQDQKQDVVYIGANKFVLTFEGSGRMVLTNPNSTPAVKLEFERRR